MFRIICPQCKSKVKRWPTDLRQWRKGIRKCGNCGAYIELANPILGGLLGAVVAGFLVFGPKYWFPDSWLGWLAAVVAACFVMAVGMRVLLKWRVIADGYEKPTWG